MRNQKQTSAPMPVGRSLAIGSLLGLVAGVGLAVADVLSASLTAPLTERVYGWALLAGSITFVAPLGAAVGGLLGLLLALTARISCSACQLLAGALSLLWLPLLLAFWGGWFEQGESGSGPSSLTTIATVLAGGLAGLGILFLLARLLTGRYARLAAVALALALVPLWIGSVVAFLSPGGATSFPATVAAPTSGRPNVLLIVLDTVRADHLSCYGYERRTTPSMDAFAEGARLYRNAVSPDCWTIPVHASFFTGLTTSAHGASWAHLTLNFAHRTLAEQLQAAGYQTAGLCSNPILRVSNGFGQGFDLYFNPPSPKRSHLELLTEPVLPYPGFLRRSNPDEESRASAVNRRLATWLAADYRPDKPFFLFLNYVEPHAPYVPPSQRLTWVSRKTYRKWEKVDQIVEVQLHALALRGHLTARQIAELRSLYDEEIAYVDGKVGEVLEFVRSHGLADNTLIIITADHGEHFGEHRRMDHQYSLYQPLLKVPLIVKYKELFPAGQESSLVQSHDLYPTILEVVGLPWSRLKGQTCQSLLSPPTSEPRVAFAEYPYPSPRPLSKLPRQLGNTFDASRLYRSLRAVQLGSLKLISPSRGEPELYDLEADPAEKRNMAPDEPAAVRELLSLLDRWQDSFRLYGVERSEPPSDTEALPKELELLEGQGFID